MKTSRAVLLSGIAMIGLLSAVSPVYAVGSAAAGKGAGEDVGKLVKKFKKSVDKGIRFLAKHQSPDGSYGGGVGITALCLRAIAESYRKYREDDGPFVSKAVDYILSNVQKDGGIYNKNQGLENYRTSVAITALVALQNPKYKDVIRRARDFVVGLQCSEENGYDPKKHPKSYGGTGYGGDMRPDITNTATAIEALKAAGLPKDHPFWKRALVFLKRVQHNTEGDGNDQAWASDDPEVRGGFVYLPGNSKAGTVKLADGREVPRPYGSVSYAGLLSLIYADVGKKDPRVRGAVDWIRRHFTVEENPYMGKQGLFYYYTVMAKCLYVMGDRYIVTPKGEKHDWAVELGKKLVSLQRPDGSWKNEVGRWWENNPHLATAYAITALNYCIRFLEEKAK